MENKNSENARTANWKPKIIAFMAGQTVSMLGSSLVQFAIFWYIAKTTNSGVTVAIATICGFIPQVLISLFAGVWADRYNRKFLVIAADSLIAISTLILAILMMNGNQEIWLLFIISGVRSVGAGIQMPAVSAIIPQLVPEHMLIKINGINGSVMSMVNLTAPAIGGAVLTYGEIYNILFVDVVTAIIGISILFFIKIPLHKKAASKEKTDYFFDLKEGLRYSFKHSFVSKLLIFYSSFTFLIIPAAFLNVLMVTRVFGDSYTYLTMNEMAFFIGSLVGGVLIGIWGGFRNRMHTLLAGCLAFGVLTFAIGFIELFWLYLIIMLLTGLAMPLFNAPIMGMLQEKVEPDIQGRVFSLVNMSFSAIMPIGIMVFGPLADVVPIQWLMIGTGLAMIVFAFVLTRFKSFMNEGLPKVVEE